MGIFSGIVGTIADTADAVVDVASSATKAGVRGAKRVADDVEKVAKDVLDPFNLFHDDDD
jgi:hypothetical protein